MRVRFPLLDRTGTMMPARSTTRGLRIAMRIVLLLHTGDFPKGLALVKKAERYLADHEFITGLGRAAQLAF